MMEVYEVIPILIFQGLFFPVKHLRFFFKWKLHSKLKKKLLMMNQAPVVQGEDSCLSGELSLSNHERKHFNLFSRNTDLSTEQTRPGLFLIPLTFGYC